MNISFLRTTLLKLSFSGSGTEAAPYQIGSLQNFYWIAEDSSRWGFHYRQTADIDASETACWECGAGWSPIGTLTTPFSGSYRGGGYTISGLHRRRNTIGRSALSST